jgi:hypothetical protein
VTHAWHELTDEQQAAKVQALIDSEPLPAIQRSINAFRRDLPEMLKTQRGKWAAYHGDERLGFANTQTELYQLAFRQGLTRHEFVVGLVEPGAFDPDEQLEVTSWESEDRVKANGPTDHGFGQVISFRDPDGNFVSIIEYSPEYW